MARLQRTLAKQDPVVRDDAHEGAMDVREARDERLAVCAFELAEPRAIDEPRNDVAHIKWLSDVCSDDAV